MGAMTFGGGYAMLPILQREVVENRGWATEEELTDYFAIGQCTPGIIAVNTATFVGQKQRGIAGGIFATLGLVFPSLIIISILAGVITNVSHLAWVENAFAGIQVCVCVLILNGTVKLLKKSVVDGGHRRHFPGGAGGQRAAGPVAGVVCAGLRPGGDRAEKPGGEEGMMAIYLRLYLEFFKTGLFAVGGGMATLPFLKEIGEATGWYTYGDLMNMLAVSESTPGPIGINMATYVGYTVGGVPGAVIATLGEITPSIIVILIVAAILKSFRDNRYVNSAFYGLRPASTGLIGGAGVAVVLEVLTCIRVASPESGIVNVFERTAGPLVNPGALVLAAVLLVLTNWVKPVKNWHPIVFILISAVVGVVFHFGGV